MASSGQMFKKIQSQPARPPGKLMRLRCRLRPLFEGYLVNDHIADRDADVVFECRGGSAKAHKVILSIVSKFFCDIFKDQKPGKVSVVSVPDIPVSIMRLILKLCYKENIKLTMNAMKDIGNYLSLFGLAWDQFNFTEEGADDDDPSVVARTSLPNIQIQTTTKVTSQPARQSLPAVQIKSQGVTQQQHQGKRIFYRTASGQLVPASALQKDVKTNGGPTYVLDTNSTIPDNAGGFKVRTVQAKAAATTGQRPILPKPAGGVAQRAAGPPVLQRISNANGSALSQQETPGIEVDVDDDQPEAGRTNTSPEAQKSINQWIASVGRESSGSPPKLVKPSTLKRRASPGSSAFATGGVKAARIQMQCSVCNAVFTNRTKWKWHEERHMGINLYKCNHCEHIFSTSRQVYQHEMMEHGIIGTEDQSGGEEEEDEGEMEDENNMGQEAPLLGHLPVGEEKHRVTVVKTLYGSHYRRLPPKASASSAQKKKAVAISKKYKMPSYEKLHHNFASRNSAIGIGNHEGEHLIEQRKLKQLHWLYVCSKCDNCADSSAKAISHYKVCYGEGGTKFEDTVTKYRQGFYGRCKCPLCPRRYTSLGGFLIHCGHMHQDYRKIFSHINSEDMLMCVNCRDKFDDPETFHIHLNEDLTCHRPSREEATDPNADGRQRPMTRLIGSNPRSARLQNRLAAVTACFEDDPVDEDAFNPVTCPICGTAEIQHVADHLAKLHPELDIVVERTAENSLRCRGCSITFAVCDLLAHNISCTGSKGLNYIAEKKTAAMSPQKPAPVKNIPIEYPPGIGTSPVEKMERTDLLSIDVLRAAFICGVCKKEGKKMNVAAECLRTHGVYRCAICFNSYLSRDQASKHLKKCHSTNSGKAICPICRLVRTNAGQLASHMWSAHWLPVLREHEVDMKANKLLNQLQESAGEEAGTSLMDTSISSGADVSTAETSMEDEEMDDPSLHVAAVLKEEPAANEHGEAHTSGNNSGISAPGETASCENTA